MRLRGVCLRTVEEQLDGGDDAPLDPETIEIPSLVPVRIGFQGHPLGVGVVQPHEGRLWFEVEIPEQDLPESFFAVGFARSAEKTVLTDIGITTEPSDHGAFPIEVVG